MDVYESDLPGVGKKHEIELGDGARLVVITHHTGKREVFRRPSPDADSEKLFELNDELARTVGTVLEGAYFPPVAGEDVETMLGEETLLEWFGVPPGSPLVGETLSDAGIRAHTGASVVVIQRDGETIPSPAPDEVIREDDTLVVVGDRESVEAFEALLTDE